MKIHPELAKLCAAHEALCARPNRPCGHFNGVFTRFANPVLTREHVPPSWRFDFDAQKNPLGQERLPVNAVFNAGALYLNGTYYLAARVEGADRKSFFALAASKNPTEGFTFLRPIVLPDTQPNETNVYDMRLTLHEDGWIYGLFCSERKDNSTPEHAADPTAAVAVCGICRTKDLLTWERLPDLQSKSPQQRNVVLFPDFVNGHYAFLTRPQDGFLQTGTGGGICYAECADITHAQIETETPVSTRRYHQITEYKNGAGATPVKTEKGWLHIAHGVRGTAAGLRYVLYVFVTALEEPWRVTAAPGGYFLVPFGTERTGDVSNVVFSNGAVVCGEKMHIYYAASDTRLHVLETTVSAMLDYAFHTPQDAGRSADCVRQRLSLITRNEATLRYTRWCENVPPDSVWYTPLQNLENDTDARFDAFYTDLQFGTGGLRGVMGPGSNRMNHYMVGKATQGLANFFKKKTPHTPLRCVVAYDTRNFSCEFAAHTAAVLTANGIQALLFRAPRPTPMLSFAVRAYAAQGGVVITASHNPSAYNGYKAYGATGGQLTDADAAACTEEIEKIDPFAVPVKDLRQAEEEGLLRWLGEDTDEAYYAALDTASVRTEMCRSHGDALQILYTPLHGSGLVPVTRHLARLGFSRVELVPSQTAPDGAFPTVTKPNPEEPQAFAEAMKIAAKTDPDVIFATDPDADRIGVMAKDDAGAYQILSGAEVGALLTEYLIEARAEQGTSPANPAVVTTIVTGTLAERIANVHGVHTQLTLTGFKYIGEVMDLWEKDAAHDFLLGFEESYGYLIGNASRDKDAVVTAALLAEAALYHKKFHSQSLWAAVQKLYAVYGPVADALLDHYFYGADGMARMRELMARARGDFSALFPGEKITAVTDYLKGTHTDYTTNVVSPVDLPHSDVLKFRFTDGAWVVLRVSGTEPKIKLYVSTNTAYPPNTPLEKAKSRCADIVRKAQKLLGDD